MLAADDIPRELAELSPAECHVGFYLDRTENGVECEAKARYGNVMVPLLPAGPAVSADDGACRSRCLAVTLIPNIWLLTW